MTMADVPGAAHRLDASEQANPPYVLRSHAAFSRFFEGLDLIEPGVTSAPFWRPTEPDPQRLDVVCGVARKP
jgi:hypothetical protein